MDDPRWDDGQEFRFRNQPVGEFLGERAPLSPGPRRYEPYRGPGHYAMCCALRREGSARCEYVRDGERVEFTVRDAPEADFLDLSDFAYFPPGHPGDPARWLHAPPRPFAAGRRVRERARRLYDDEAAGLPVGPTEVVLAGLRLDPDSDGPESFSLITHHADGVDRPVVIGGRLAFMTYPSRVDEPLERCPPELRAVAVSPPRVAFDCDVAGALYRLQSVERDDEGIVVDAVLLLHDLVVGVGVQPPAWTRAAFIGPDIREACDSGRIPRRDALDAVAWYVGTVMTLRRMF